MGYTVTSLGGGWNRFYLPDTISAYAPTPSDSYQVLLGLQWDSDPGEVRVDNFGVPEPTTVPVDIKPASWPNPINPKSNGRLPVAVLGTDELDVMDIDPNTILLTREGFAETVSPLRWSYEDVGTPFDGEPGEGHDLGPDGLTDLTLKFAMQDVVDLLGLGAPDGDTLELILRGLFTDAAGGGVFEGSDWVWVLHWGDVDLDGNVDNLDITPFVGLRVGGSQAIPEPATLSLLALGGLMVLRRRRR